MADTTLQRIEKLPENQVAPVLEDVYDSIFRVVPYDDVLASAQAMDELAGLTAIAPEASNVRIPGKDVAAVGRDLLGALARDEATEPFVAEACDRAEADDSLFVGTMIVAGAVVNLTYLVMATDIKVTRDEDGKVKLSAKKKASAPDFIGTMVGNVLSVLKGG